MSSEIILSVCMPTYNHEKYIGKAIESVLMQKTEYAYELIIGDDCSTDGTAQIVQYYYERYPEIIRPFFREKNMNNDLIKNYEDLTMHCQGKYMIVLEGDDYWIDPYKIDRQIKFLEENKKYIAVAHNCVVVDQNSKEKEENFPGKKFGEYTLKDFELGIMPGQTASVMFRNIYKNKSIDKWLLTNGKGPGDTRMWFTMLGYGKIYTMPEKMSAYRHVTSFGGSYSATHKWNFQERVLFQEFFCEYSERMKNQEMISCSKIQMAVILLRGLARSDIGVIDFMKNNMKYRCNFIHICIALFAVIKSRIKK